MLVDTTDFMDARGWTLLLDRFARVRPFGLRTGLLSKPRASIDIQIMFEKTSDVLRFFTQHATRQYSP